MRYLSIDEVLEIYTRIIQQSGGTAGILSLDSLESALAQPQMTFGGQELYPTIVEKASILGFCLINNHPFIDGNKRIAHGAMEIFLVLNGFEIDALVDEQEQIILLLASAKLKHEEFTEWLGMHIVSIKP